MTDLRTAAQQALESLEWHLERGAYGADIEGVTGNLRAALSQQAEPETLDDALTLPRAMAQAYEAGYKAGQASEREACERACKHHPHWVACVAAIRARGNT